MGLGRRQQSDIKAAFCEARLAMAIIDRDARVLMANRALGTLLGTTPESLAGTALDELAPLGFDASLLSPATDTGTGTGTDSGEEASCDTGGRGGGTPGTYRTNCVRRLKNTDGHTLWAELTLSPTGRHGETLLCVADISEQHDLRERLRHLQMHDPVTRLPNRTLFFERLATALADTATGRIGICYLDLDGFKAVNDTLGHRVGDELLDAVARRLTQCAQGHSPAQETGRDRPTGQIPAVDLGLDLDPAARETGNQDQADHPDQPDQPDQPGASSGAAQQGHGQGHLVARLGGDEFALLVDGSTGTQQLTALAQAALAALQRPFELAGQRLAVSASIGVVEREAEGTSPTELMQAADTTLYWAKADGKARWTLFDPERNAHRMTRQALSSALRGAVGRGEFVLEYQPIVGLADDRLRGVEALVRWRHPQFGTLGPNQFIGLAEENGAVVPLGLWVLEESCRQASRWMREHPGPPIYISVNVAVRQVWDSDLVADVARILRETGLPSGLLQLELTESAVMGSAGRPLQALHQLSEMGVRIAIDDFGTGYSNLAYLSRLPVRTLKLDGSFVRGFQAAPHPNPADETIVTALIQLAHQLGLTVTAECVEGPTQADRLRRIGCDTGQGWHYARPLPPEHISAMLGEGPPGQQP